MIMIYEGTDNKGLLWIPARSGHVCYRFSQKINHNKKVATGTDHMMGFESAGSRQLQRSSFSNQMNLRPNNRVYYPQTNAFPQRGARGKFLRFTGRDDPAFSASSITVAEHRAS